MFGGLSLARLIVWALIVAAAVSAVMYAVHLYNDSIRAPLEQKLAEQKKAYEQTIAADEGLIDKLQASVVETEKKVKDANARVDDFKAASDAASVAATAAIAKAAASARQAAAKDAELRARASGPPTHGEFVEQAKVADVILSEYAHDIDAAMKALGLR